MPALSSTTGKSAAAEKKIRRKKKIRVRRASTRPAPAHQPGPYTDTEHRKVERNRKTPAYQKAVQKARVHGPATRRGTGPGEAKGDEEFRKGQRYVRAQYLHYRSTGRKQFADPDTLRYHPGTTVPPDVRERMAVRKFEENRQAKNATVAAPVLKVLEQTTRPLHAIAAAARSDVKEIKQKGLVKAIGGGQGRKAALKGLKNKDKSTFSDVLKEAGAPKIVRSVGGFALDVGLDPTTYVSGGTAGLARKAALKDAKRVAEKTAGKTTAARTATTNKEANRAAARLTGGGADAPSLAERARRRTERTGDRSKGVVVRYAGKDLPGVTKATSKAAAPVRKIRRRAGRSKLATGARHVASDVNPNAAPAGVSREVSDRAVQATRTARAKSNQGQRAAVNLAHAIRTKIGEENYRRVVDAIEAGKIKGLPPALRDDAKRLADRFKHIRRIQRQAGVKVADVTKSPQIKGYVPRQIIKTVDEGAKGGKPGVGRRVIKPASSKGRKEKRRLADVREERPGLYREDLHALAAERLAEGSTSAARAGLNRELADLGDPVRRGEVPNPGDGEAVFHIKGSDIREVTDAKELDRIGRPLTPNKKGTKLKGANKQGGRYVVLSKEMVKRSLEGAQPTLQGPGIVHALDKVTVGFKRLAIATPGFHVRNLVGDLQNAYLGQPAHHLPANMRRAGKILRAHSGSEKALRQLKPEDVGRATVKTGKYGAVTYDEVAKQLAERGAFRSGYIAGELRELSKSGGVSTGRVARTVRKGREKVGQTKVAQGTKRAVLAREDLPRLTTAMEALRRGATWDEAAHTVASLHFDYQHLTNFERQIARRAMPFYTWSARNIPLQARKVVTRPGKYANYQKIRENAAKTVSADDVDPQTKDMYRQLEQAGVKMPGGWERYLTEWEQRNAGVPVSWKGSKFTISLGLPLQDLNEAPGAAGLRQLNEYYQKGMSLTGPVPKDVVEYFENHSFFFRDEIERENSPLVAAPDYVGRLPGSLRGKLGITKIVDKKSGKMVWAWPGKMDYLAKAVPGTPNYIQQLATSGTDRRGKGTTGKVLAYLGVKAVPIDASRNAVNMAYARMDEIAKEKAKLNQQGINAKHSNAQYTKLLAQEKVLRGIAFRGKTAQGYKVLPETGGPPKIKVSKPGGFDFSQGQQDFDFEGGSSGFDFGG